MLVSHADPQRDAVRCAAVYGPNVDGSGVSFEDVAPGAEQFAARIADAARHCAWLLLEDQASVALHRAPGLEHVGSRRDIGWKAGAWRDAAWWQLQLAPATRDVGSPPKPRGPQRLSDR